MTTSIVDTPAETSATDSALRRSLFIGLIILVVTSVIALVGGIAWPAPKSGDWYGYADVAPIRDRSWIVLRRWSRPTQCSTSRSRHWPP